MKTEQASPAGTSLPDPLPPDTGKAVDQVLKLLQSGGTIGQYLGHSDESMEALYSLGYSLYGQGKYKEAERAFGALLVCNHTDRRVYQSYAACLQMQHRYEDALRYYAISAAMNLLDPAPVFYSAECLLALDKREDALSSLRHMLDMPRRTGDEKLFDRARGLLQLLEPAPAAGATASN